MTPEQQTRFKELYEEMYLICGGLDPFSYARAREIYMAAELNHKVADNYSGEDGLDENGKPVEYKSTINKKIQGTYNGSITSKDFYELQNDQKGSSCIFQRMLGKLRRVQSKFQRRQYC